MDRLHQFLVRVVVYVVLVSCSGAAASDQRILTDCNGEAMGAAGVGVFAPINCAAADPLERFVMRTVMTQNAQADRPLHN